MKVFNGIIEAANQFESFDMVTLYELDPEIDI